MLFQPFQTRTTLCLLVALLGLGKQAWSLDESVARIGADQSAALLGFGTDVIVGIVDSGIDATHPSLSTVDSRGRSRQVAAQNFVPTEPDNQGEDLVGHGTAVAGVVLGSDAEFGGVAPDARFINSRTMDVNNTFDVGAWPLDATGFAIQHGADVLNLSLNFFATTAASSSGTFTLDRLLDWAAFDRSVASAVCIGNVSNGNDQVNTPRSPAGSFNTIAVGQTGPDNYGRLHSDSAFGPTSDGRLKPDLVAPGRRITAPSFRWSTATDFFTFNGCSFATPHVAGAIAQLIGYAKANQQTVTPRIIKATLLNSAEKITDVNGQPWQPYASEVEQGVWQISAPLDEQLGAGQLDVLAAAHQYLAGTQSTGNVPRSGWSEAVITGQDAHQFSFELNPGPDATITATLVWDRRVQRTDDGDELINSADQFIAGSEGDVLDNLDLILLHEGQPVARSVSTRDNVEHFHWTAPAAGRYTLRVVRRAVAGSGDDETYALAWYTKGFRGDFLIDGQLNAADIDLLTKQINTGNGDLDFDLNQDGRLDQFDRRAWVVEIANTYFGDANLDGAFNTSDLTHVFQVGQYEDELLNNSTWGTGDWNGDQEFNSSDMVLAFQDGGYEQGPRTAVQPVPEPTFPLTWFLFLPAPWFDRSRPRGGG